MLLPSSNKPAYPPKETIKPHLLIDRITLVGNEPNPETRDQMLEVASGMEESFDYLRVYTPPYRFSFKKAFGPNGTKVFFQIGNKSPKKPFVRIDMNPAALTKEGIKEFYTDLELMMPMGSGWLKKYARITRIDVATDLPGIGLADIGIIPDQPLVQQTFSRQGRLETIYLGGVKSLRRVRIYDKLVQLATKGVAAEYEKLTRIEVVAKAPWRFAEISEMPCPFGHLTVVELPINPVGVNRHHWQMFRYMAASVGVNAALASVPHKTRPRYRKAAKAGAVDWWDVPKLWSQWPSAVTESHLMWQLHPPVVSGVPQPF